MKPALAASVMVLAAAVGAVFLVRARTTAPSTPRAASAGSGPAASHPAAIAGVPEPALARDREADGVLRLEGQVIDAADKPVAGAIVTINSLPPRMASSDVGGSFAFDRLVGRTYLLIARARGQAAGPAAVRLTATTQPLTLRLAPAASVDVQVVTATDRRPVAGAQVELRGVETRGASADRDGKASFDGVSPGAHTLAAWAPGFARSFSRFRIPGQFVSTGMTLRQQLELRAGGPVSGRVLSAAGQPVAGAAVTYVSAANSFEASDPRRDAVESDATGSFRFDALPAGSFRFQARHPEHGPGMSPLVTLNGASERAGIEVRLEAGASIEGVVVAKDGSPAPGATLRLTEQRPGGSEPPQQAFADASGRFRMTGLPRRAVALVALSEAASSETLRFDLAATPERRDVRITLGLADGISGVVINGNGRPVADASVWATRRGDDGPDRRLRGPLTDVTGLDGRFQLRGLLPGTYLVFATRSGDLPSAGPRRGATSARSGETDVRVLLEAGGSIKGRVLLSDGQAPPFFTVRVGREGAVPFGNADGAFLLEEVPAGEVHLVVGGPGFEPARATAQVSVGHIADVGTITVKPGRTISGHVWNANHRPVAGATVYGGATIFGNGTQAGGSSTNLPWAPVGGSPAATATSDERGGFVLAGVGTSGLVLLAEHDSYGRSRAVTVPASGDSTNVDLVLAPFASLDGLVTQDGHPAAGVVVTASSQTAPDAMFTVKADPAGAFTFDRLAPDRYRVTSMGALGRGGRGFHSTVLTLAAGEKRHVNLSFDSQGVTLVVTTQPEGTAMVYAVQGAITAATARALRAAVAASGSAFTSIGMSSAGRPARISGVKPGAYTLCAFAMPQGTQGGPAGVANYIAREGDKIPAICQPREVAEEPPEQSITVSLPPPVVR